MTKTSTVWRAAISSLMKRAISFDVVDREGKLITTFLGGDNMNEAFRSAIHFARENGYSHYKIDQETLDKLRRKHQFGSPIPKGIEGSFQSGSR